MKPSRHDGKNRLSNAPKRHFREGGNPSSAERLFTHFDRIAGAPDAVPHLRRFILDLAVRGKLVPQNQDDEPASELLKRIAAEVVHLTKTGEFQEPRSFVSTERGGLPFHVASHWGWIRLIEVAKVSYGFPFPSNQFNSAERGMPLIRIRDISSKDTEAYFEGSYDIAYLVRGGDYLVGMDGNFNLRRWDGRDGLLNQRVMRLNDWRCDVVPEFIKIPLQSILDHLNGGTSLTTVKHLSAKQVNGIEIPLPPLAEQHRIVAKVDELMALCNRLEAARTERETTRNRLAAASLARLNAPDPDPAVFRNDAAFALDNLTPLTTRPDQIKALRQTVLNLAVRGKLVPQDPNDESASELLKKIAARKMERKRKTGDTRIVLKPTSKHDELPMLLPHGWAIQSFENLFLFIDYRGKTPSKTNDGVPLITAKNIRMGYLNREPREYISVETFKTWMTRGIPEIGDLFFTTEAPLANVCLNNIDEPFALAQRTICLQPYGEVSTKFLMFSLMSGLMQLLIDGSATGTTAKGIKAASLKPLPIPIPPLAEQYRIVAKVDELMALCDRLEASLTTRDETRGRLIEAVLHEALEQIRN